MQYTHPEFSTEQSLHERMRALPATAVYHQLTQRQEWGLALMAVPVTDTMRQSIVRWIALGRDDQLGGFLRALLSNDLMGAFARADEQNAAAMHKWCIFLHNYAPAGCYGSPEAVRQWPGLLERMYRAEEQA